MKIITSLLNALCICTTLFSMCFWIGMAYCAFNNNNPLGTFVSTATFLGQFVIFWKFILE